MSDSRPEEPPVTQVESVDSSEQSINEQLVQLAQAKLDGRIDELTYERLVGLVKELQPIELSKSIEYASPRKGRSTISKMIGAVFASLLLVLICLAIFPHKPPATLGYSPVTATVTDVANLETALDAFEIDNGRYPTQREGLGVLLNQPPGLSNWRGPYIRAVPLDGWGRSYIYTVPGTHHPNGFDLYSVGRDGKAGTVDDIANWDTGN